MRQCRFSRLSARQRGVALLVLMLLIFLAATTWMLGQSGATGARNRADEATAIAMAQAKEALIGRAAIDDNRPGSLPCPALDENGVSPLLIGNDCPSYIGRLPWKTLRVGDLRDSAGQPLWYALAPALRDDDSAQPINSQQPVDLTLDGAPNIAAIIISAGVPLANQNGRPGNAVADYLDGSNNDGDSAYVSGPPSPNFNDRVVAITREEIFLSVSQRVLAEVRGPNDTPTGPPTYGLRRYYADNGQFPWADSGSDGIGDADTGVGTLRLPYKELVISPASLVWLSANGWLPLVTYQRLSPHSARIGIIGSSKTMEVIPCSSSPCP